MMIAAELSVGDPVNKIMTFDLPGLCGVPSFWHQLHLSEVVNVTAAADLVLVLLLMQS